MEFPKRPDECRLAPKLFLSLQFHSQKTFNSTLIGQLNLEIRTLHPFRRLNFLESTVIRLVAAELLATE